MNGLDDLIGVKISSFEISTDHTVICFIGHDDDPIYYLCAIDDCCSNTWFNHVTMPHSSEEPEYRVIQTIHYIDIGEVIPTRQKKDQLYCITITFQDDSGMLIEMRNSSNGYYGGDVKLSSVAVGQYDYEKKDLKFVKLSDF